MCFHRQHRAPVKHSARASRRTRLETLRGCVRLWFYPLFPTVLEMILIVQPETEIRWHRRVLGYWR